MPRRPDPERPSPKVQKIISVLGVPDAHKPRRRLPDPEPPTQFHREFADTLRALDRLKTILD
jgi:hypothetical protein